MSANRPPLPQKSKPIRFKSPVVDKASTPHHTYSVRPPTTTAVRAIKCEAKRIIPPSPSPAEERRHAPMPPHLSAATRGGCGCSVGGLETHRCGAPWGGGGTLRTLWTPDLITNAKKNKVCQQHATKLAGPLALLVRGIRGGGAALAGAEARAASLEPVVEIQEVLQDRLRYRRRGCHRYCRRGRRRCHRRSRGRPHR